MRIKKNILITVIISVQLLLALSAHGEGIYLYSPGSLVLYENYSGSELNLFAKSKFILKLPANTRLKLLDEFSHDNPLFTDVLKVEVTEGSYRGRVGYLAEDGVFLDEASLNGGEVVLKRDFMLGEQVIKGESRCAIVGLQPLYGGQILMLRVEHEGRQLSFSCSDRELFRYSLGYSKDIEYYNREGYSIVKVVDSSTLLPLERVNVGGLGSTDSYGLIYLPPSARRRAPLNLQREGYLAGSVTIEKGLNLFLLQPLERVELPGKARTLPLEDGRRLIVRGAKGGSLLFNSTFSDPFAPFTYPGFEQMGPVSGGFYLEFFGETEASFEGKSGERLYYYDEGLSRWIIVEQVDKKVYSLKGNGFYLYAKKEKRESAGLVEIGYEAEEGALLYLRGENGDYLTISPGATPKLEKGRYEGFTFKGESPYYLLHSIYPLEKSQVIKPVAGRLFSPAGEVPPLFRGVWHRYAVKKGKLAAESRGELEYFEQMELFPRRITFINGEATLKGQISLEERGRVKIKLYSATLPVKDEKLGRYIRVSPSLFDNRLTIYGRADLVSGLYELSFDTIVVESLRFYSGGGIENALFSGELSYVTEGYVEDGYIRLYFESVR